MIYLLSSSFHDGVENLPMIEFVPTANSIDFSSYDILLFTSQNAVSIINEINPAWLDFPCIAIGSQTAKKIKELGGLVIGVSESYYASSLSQMIREKFANKRILYIRPKEIASNALLSLKDHDIDIDDRIIYETKCKNYDISHKPPKGAVIIATSPSTIKCFVKNFRSFDGYKVVAIGDTTAAALPAGTDFVIASKPVIAECIKLAKEI
ncbi:MAG: uroporphyrinogen-III synthase [Sulfurovaceae bacterium]|nr:uroporphyrinogen-III synthase [Sulfurovaceae bacterium]